MVGFDSEFDTIELKHEARSRAGFALGAVLVVLGMAAGAALYAGLGAIAPPPAGGTVAGAGPVTIQPATAPPPADDTKISIKTNSYEDLPAAPAAAPATPAVIAADTAAPIPAAAPAATAVKPAPATDATLLQERLAATAAWLDDAQPQTYTIQLLGANDDQQLNQHLKFLSNIIEMNRLFVYRTVAKGAPSLTVVWGSFDTQRAALQAMAQLPPFLKAYRPLLRTVQGIKAEIGDQKTK